jgi:hypothetical protein
MTARLKAWGRQMLIGIDQLLGCWLRGWFFVWGRGECPSADETISSWVGRKAIAGKHWALVAEKLIDRIMGAGHCRRSIENLPQDVTPCG